MKPKPIVLFLLISCIFTLLTSFNNKSLVTNNNELTNKIQAPSSLYEPRGIGGGGAMSAFSMSSYDHKLCLVGTDMDTLFRSTDRGKHWQSISHLQATFSAEMNVLIELIGLLYLWLKSNKILIIGLGVSSLVMILLSILIVPFLVVKLPDDYFLQKKHGWRPSWMPHILFIILIVLKNIFGIICILLGLLMLILPGQGIITILLGIILTDIPGERKLLLFILKKTPVLKAVNWLRRKNHKSPFILPAETKTD